MAEHDYSDFKEDEKLVDSTLSQISKLAMEQKTIEADIAKIEADLKVAQNKLRDVSEFRLPALMDSVGMAEFCLTDGSKVKVKETIRASIPPAFEKDAFKYLEESRNEHIIKRQFTIDFNRDQEDWAKKFEEELDQREDKLNYKCKRSVNPQTLAAFVREQLAEGSAIPLDVFGVYKQRSTKIE